MPSFAGKKLLLLGTSVGTVDILRYAQECGAEVYITDCYPDRVSEAKILADGVFHVDTALTDELIKLVEGESFDCVYAGISEFNLLQAIRVSQKCGLPFYCTEQQWNLLGNKLLLRELCERYDVPTPATYRDWRELAPEAFPVFVKPVDGTASRGVRYCADSDSMAKCVEDALRNSPEGKVIVEECVQGYEFTVHYTIVEGSSTLSCIDNRYPVAVHAGRVTTIPAGRVYPSLFVDSYLKRVDQAVRDMIDSLDLKSGIVFLQGIYNPDEDKFAVFEGGLRSAGECPYRFLEPVNGVNNMKLLLDSMLASPEKGRQSWEDDPLLRGSVCGVISFVGTPGLVAEVRGLSHALSMKQVVDYELRYPAGDEIPDTDTLAQLALRFYLVCDSRAELAEVIAHINNEVDIVDESGSSLVIKMDPSRVMSYD